MGENVRWGRFFMTRWIARFVAPQFSWCLKCRTPWRFVTGHTTGYYDEWSGGCFPLCEKCWAELTPSERLPFYERLVFTMWEDQSKWPVIKAAVEAGR